MKVILSAINSRHTHKAIALAYLKCFWERLPDRIPLEIREFDINQTNEFIYSELILEKPDIVCFSVYIWSLERVLAISTALKAALPGIRIILGGPEVSYSYEKILNQLPDIDFIVRGEGEETLEELLQVMIAGQSAKNVAGIAFSDSGRVYATEERKLLMELDSIPSPFQRGLLGNGGGFTYYEASRGCHSKCTYCLSSVQGNVRYHSLDRVKNDLDWFFSSNFRQVRFADRTFNYNRSRAKEIITYIIENNHRGINFHFEIQADFLSDEIIDLLASAPEGMFHLEIGVQSTNPRALTSVNRKFELSRMKTAIMRLRKETGCHLHLDLLGGLPQDSFLDFLNSLDQIWTLSPHSIQISLVKVLRGTPLELDVNNGNIFCMHLPPYTVLRTRWLTSNEAVSIQDIGKLVEGIYNSMRFPLSLDYIVKELFSNCCSAFFLELASFWRQYSIQFFNFGPENIYEKLLDFLNNKKLPDQKRIEIEVILEHELHLNQKVPSGESSIGPEFQSGKNKCTFKVVPGLKTFWYKTDIENILKGKENDMPGSFPAVYRYEKDLSSIPNTRMLSMPLPERFVLAALQRKIVEERLPMTWQACFPEANYQPDFSIIIEKLLRLGLLYNPRETNYQQVKKLIFKNDND
ncbi:MAG: hypothetical protein Kow0029_13060 [Candidatus Rifleibacteriota bacterium]